MRHKWSTMLGALSLVLAACTESEQSAVADRTAPATLTTTTSFPQVVTSLPDVPAGSFRSIADRITVSLLERQPELVTELGARSFVGFEVNHLLNDLSPRGVGAVQKAAVDGSAALAAVDRQSLTAAERLSADILDWVPGRRGEDG